MVRSAGDINPDDVFPPRDLGAAENWGRTLEDRVVALEKAVVQSRQQQDSDNRAFTAALAQIIVASQSQGAFSSAKMNQTISSSGSVSAGVFTTTSVTVPVGAITATLNVKGFVTATNDSYISPPENLTLMIGNWYSHLAAGIPWEPGLIGSYTPFTYETSPLPTGATATAVTSGSVTIPVIPGYTLIVGTDSRFVPTASVQSTNNAATSVVGNIVFNYPV